MREQPGRRVTKESGESGERARVVWVVNHYAAIASKDGSVGRHHELARYLASFGWNTILFVASTSHPTGRQTMFGRRLREQRSEDGVAHLTFRAPRYEGSGLRRIVNMLVFTAQVLFGRHERLVPSPSAVIGSTVHLLAAWAAMVQARRHRVPFIFEIRDVWPESLIDLGHLSPKSLLSRLIRAFSVHLCRRADLVISPLPGVRGYLDEIGLPRKPFRWVSNGVDEAEPTAIGHSEPHADASQEFTLMYLGSFGHANGLDGLIEAFGIAAQSDPRLRLRLIGDGSQRQRLQKKALGFASAHRITFEDRVPRAEVPALAATADCLVVNIEDLPVYRFGISLNKVFDYMLAARPVIIASNAVNNPILEGKAGLCVAADDPTALARAMIEMAETDPEQRAAMGRRGRAHVVENYSYRALAADLAESLDSVLTETEADA